MKLEDAVKLKPGTQVEATFSWDSPGKITKGKKYTVLRSIPSYLDSRGGWADVTRTPVTPGQNPCNCLFEMEDDRGEIAQTPYGFFVPVGD